MTPEHWDELVNGSAIDPELAILNCRSIAGEELFDPLYPRIPGKNGEGDKRYLNRGILSSEYQRHFNKCENSSGWIFEAVNPETGKPSEYIRVKLDKGSALGEQWEKDDDGNWKKSGKFAKYKSAKASGIQIPFPAVPESIWKKCSQTTQQRIKDELHFWQWVESNPDIPIVIVEGEKKAMCLLSLGIPAIPLTGVYNWIAKKGSKELHPDLKRFAQKGRKFVICFDNDAKAKTRRDVGTAQFQLGLALKKAGCEVKIATVPRTSKNKGAIDDYVVAGGNGLKVIGDAVDFDVLQTKRLKGLNRKPDLLLNQRYLDFELPLDRKIVAIRSPKGTGKTELLSRQVKPRIDAGLDKGLGITHRTKLGIQTAQRVGIKYVDHASLEDIEKRGVFLCFDSLVSGGKGQVRIEDWKGAVVILDEADQSAIHALMSSTCSYRRPEILENLEAILKIAKQVLLMSADLNDTVIEWIEGMVGDGEKAFVVDNQYEDESFNYDAIIYDQSAPDAWACELFKAIERGEKLFVPLSAQQEDSKYSSTAFESEIRRRFPDKKVLRMDSVTTSDPLHPASQAIENSEVLKQYDVVLATPVIETGFNIPFHYFDAVYGLGRGLIPSNNFRQSIGRVRPPIPRHLWISKKALPASRIGSGATTVKQLIEAENKKDQAIKVILLRTKVIEDESGFDCLVNDIHFKTWAKLAAPINAESHYYRKAVVEGLEGEGHRIYTYDEWVQASVLSEQEFEQEFEKSEPDERPLHRNPTTEEILKNLPQAKGQIEGMPPVERQLFDFALARKNQEIEGDRVEVKKTLKINRDQVRLKRSEEIVNAEFISDSDYEKIKVKPQKTEGEVLSILNKSIEKKYNIPVDLDLVERDWNKRYHSQIKLHYAFSIGREFVNEKQQYKIEQMLNSETGKRFIPDSNKQLSISLKLFWLDFLDFDKLIEQDEISRVHPIAVRIWEKAQKYKDDLRSMLKISVGNKPMQFFQSLAGLIGWKFPYLRKETIDGKRIEIYGCPNADFELNEKGKPRVVNGKAIPLPDRRDEFFEAQKKKDLEIRAKNSDKVKVREAAEAQLQQLQSEMTQAQFEPDSKINPEPQPEPQLESEPEPLPPEVLEVKSLLEVAANHKDTEKLESALLAYGLETVKKAAPLIFEECGRAFWWLAEQEPKLEQAFQ